MRPAQPDSNRQTTYGGQFREHLLGAIQAPCGQNLLGFCGLLSITIFNGLKAIFVGARLMPIYTRFNLGLPRSLHSSQFPF